MHTSPYVPVTSRLIPQTFRGSRYFNCKQPLKILILLIPKCQIRKLHIHLSVVPARS